jgi:hypothetical protein
MSQNAILFTTLRGPIGPIVGRANQQGFVYTANPAGRTWFVDTVNGSDTNSGTVPSDAFATMGRAFYTDYVAEGVDAEVPNLKAGDTIIFVGKVREQLVAPLLGTDGVALTGVSIIGGAQGGVRDDDGAKWTYPASGAVAGQALLACRQQGWGVANFLMTPEPTSGACVKLNRAEDAVNPDASHFVSTGMRYVGIDVTTTYGIQDVGGCSAVKSIGDEFYLLTTGLFSSSQAIAVPLRWQVMNGRFIQNTNDIIVPSSACLYQGNAHFTDNTVVMNIAVGATNTVRFNSFPNVVADIDPAHGYTGNADDIWTSNSAKDAVAFGQPA